MPSGASWPRRPNAVRPWGEPGARGWQRSSTSAGRPSSCSSCSQKWCPMPVARLLAAAGNLSRRAISGGRSRVGETAQGGSRMTQASVTPAQSFAGSLGERIEAPLPVQAPAGAARLGDERLARWSSLGRGIVRALRPKQWLKNVLVLAAPGAAGVLGQGDVLANVALAFVAFCAASSGTYLLNDVRDVEADRLHPRKRARPIAAGTVPGWLAVALAVVLLVAGLVVAASVGVKLLVVLAAYIALTSSYTLWLKHIEVVDIVAIASGFILRAVAGGAAAGVPLSRWFIIVASFGSLFIVAGKRH